MTTIAFKDGVMAADSRAVADGMGITSSQKLFKIKVKRTEHLIGGCGWHPSLLMFNEWYKTRDKELASRIHTQCVGDKSFEALIWTGKKLYSCDESLMIGEEFEQACSIGSGAAHAITAMDCGKSAVEAVRLAAKRDMNTGGRIVSARLNNDKT
jgi:20S proteasome alpha/beta subunit